MAARTRRQQEVLDVIHQHLENNGYRPSYQEIATSLKLRSRGGIARMVSELEDQGLLERRRESGHFTIEVTRNGSSPVEWISSGSDSDEAEKPLQLPALITGDYEPQSLRLFRVNDGGMSPEIMEDDVAIIELRDFCRPGQTILAKLDGELILRKYYRTGSEITLRPANEAFPPLHTPTNRLQIIGIHRGLIRPAV